MNCRRSTPGGFAGTSRRSTNDVVGSVDGVIMIWGLRFVVQKCWRGPKQEVQKRPSKCTPQTPLVKLYWPDIRAPNGYPNSPDAHGVNGCQIDLSIKRFDWRQNRMATGDKFCREVNRRMHERRLLPAGELRLTTRRLENWAVSVLPKTTVVFILLARGNCRPDRIQLVVETGHPWVARRQPLHCNCCLMSLLDTTGVPLTLTQVQ